MEELSIEQKAKRFDEALEKARILQEPTKVRTEKKYDNDVEYICTDAFIEKACDAYCKVCGHYAHTTPTFICRQACDYYKDFKNYIKGE